MLSSSVPRLLYTVIPAIVHTRQKESVDHRQLLPTGIGHIVLDSEEKIKRTPDGTINVCICMYHVSVLHRCAKSNAGPPKQKPSFFLGRDAVVVVGTVSAQTLEISCCGTSFS